MPNNTAFCPFSVLILIDRREDTQVIQMDNTSLLWGAPALRSRNLKVIYDSNVNDLRESLVASLSCQDQRDWPHAGSSHGLTDVGWSREP
jgi:hypothetical protein